MKMVEKKERKVEVITLKDCISLTLPIEEYEVGERRPMKARNVVRIIISTKSSDITVARGREVWKYSKVFEREDWQTVGDKPLGSITLPKNIWNILFPLINLRK